MCDFHLHLDGRFTFPLGKMLLSIFILRMAKYLCAAWWMWFWFMSWKYTHIRPNGSELHKLIKKPLVCCCDCCWCSHKITQAPHIKISILLIWPHSLYPQTHLHMICVCTRSLCVLFSHYTLGTTTHSHDSRCLPHFTQFAIISAAEFEEERRSFAMSVNVTNGANNLIATTNEWWCTLKLFI